MNKVVTRIAPSPTGKFLHLGNLRTLLYNYFLAKQSGGKFFVRLEDTDKDRYTPEFLQYFRDTCDWLGIVPDASYWNPDPSIGSFIQSERDYSDKIKYLLDNGYAYYAFDTKEDLEKIHSTIPNFKYDSHTRLSMCNSFTLSKDDVNDRINRGDKYIIRFAVPSDLNITFKDAILGDITINTNQLDDKVLLKSNGIGSYHLCNVCDDHDMGVTHVLRGQEWVNSTPFHILLYKAFGWNLPIFCHFPLIMNPDGRGKLSKRTASKYGIPIAPIGYIDSDGKFVDGWRESGFEPDVLINTLSLIGWSPEGENEILSMNDLINQFSLDRVHKSGAKFDMDKAKHFNSYYLNNMRNNDYLLKHIDMGNQYSYSNDDLNEIIDICKKRSIFNSDLQIVADIFFKPISMLDKKSFTEDYNSVFSLFLNKIGDIDWKAENIKQCIYNCCVDNNVKMGKIMPSLRMSITGGLSGPDLITTMKILGRTETINRIKKSLN